MGDFNRDGKPRPSRNFGRRDFGRRSFGNKSGRREMHKAVCSKCGKDCEVPFEPTSGKPVYCSECFEKRGGGTSLRKPDFEKRSQSAPQNNDQLEAISHKLDKIIELLETKSKPDKITTITPITLTPKKTKTLKKKTPIVKK